MMEAIIEAASGSYRMSVIFVRKQGTYTLQFNSLSNNQGQETTGLSFMEARERFINNYRFYTGRELPDVAVPFTEEQFLGITPGLLYPRRKEALV